METVLTVTDDRHHISRLVASYARVDGAAATAMVEHPLDEMSIIKMHRTADTNSVLIGAMNRIIRDLNDLQSQVAEEIETRSENIAPV
tara:strand:+ start:40 stop:303 length:264 start_codon:yes stop_codon:yes gene_type:complete